MVSYSIKDYKAFGNLTFGSGYFSMYSAYLGQNAGKIDSFLSSGLFNNQDYKYEIDDLYSNEINEDNISYASARTTKSIISNKLPIYVKTEQTIPSQVIPKNTQLLNKGAIPSAKRNIRNQ